MSEENKFVRAREGDINRCIAVGIHGQCPYLADPGSVHCIRHKGGGGPPLSPHDTPGMVGGNYALKKQFAGRVADKAASSQLKDLKEEVAVLRMTLEAILNRCEDDYELEMQTDRIAKLVDQINKVVLNCHKMQMAANTLLDKNIVINIGNMVVDILSKHVPDKTILTIVGQQIYDAIAKSATSELELS